MRKWHATYTVSRQRRYLRHICAHLSNYQHLTFYFAFLYPYAMHPNRLKAARDGKRYFQAGPCRKCAVDQWYVSTGKCVACTSKRTKEYYAAEKAILDEARGSK